MKNQIITALAAILAIPAMAAPAGYFQIPGTETTMKVYGKAETWGSYGFNGFEDVTTVDGSHANNNRSGQVDSWVYARLGVTTTTPSAYGDVNVKVEYQAQSGAGRGNGGDSFKAGTPDDPATPANEYVAPKFTSGSALYLRHAYGEFAGVLIGQTDTLFSAWHNVPGYLETLYTDFNGSTRTRQIRYTFAPAKGVQVAFSMEQDNAGSTGGVKIAPALVGAFQYGADWGNVTASVAYARKEAWTQAATVKGTGTSFAISGAFNLGENDSFTAHVQNGGGFYGFGGDFDGFYASGNDYKFYKVTSMDLGYTHVWNSAFASNAGIGMTSAKKDLNAGVDQKYTLSELFLNTTWQATKNAKFGAEYKWAEMKGADTAVFEKKDGSFTKKNTDSRFLLMFQYMFF